MKKIGRKNTVTKSANWPVTASRTLGTPDSDAPRRNAPKIAKIPIRLVVHAATNRIASRSESMPSESRGPPWPASSPWTDRFSRGRRSGRTTNRQRAAKPSVAPTIPAIRPISKLPAASAETAASSVQPTASSQAAEATTVAPSGVCCIPISTRIRPRIGIAVIDIAVPMKRANERASMAAVAPSASNRGVIATARP